MVRRDYRQDLMPSGLSKEYDYDVSALCVIDPNLILYEQTGPVLQTGLVHAVGIAVDDSNAIWVAGDQVVRVLDPRGGTLRQFPVAGSPRCLALDAGTVYVGCTTQVQVYDANGTTLSAWPDLGPRATVTSMAVTADSVWVADAGQRICLRFDKTGRLLGRVGQKDASRNIPGFVIPSPHFDVAAAPDGLVRIVNPGMHKIEAYTAAGDLELVWGEFSSRIEGFTGCCNPAAMAICPNGDIATCEKGIVRVKLYDPHGTFIGVVAGPDQLGATGGVVCLTPEQCRTGAFDLAVDRTGRVYVLDTVRNGVRVFEKKSKQEGASRRPI